MSNFNNFAPKLSWKNSHLGNSKKSFLNFWPNLSTLMCWVTKCENKNMASLLVMSQTHAQQYNINNLIDKLSQQITLFGQNKLSFTSCYCILSHLYQGLNECYCFLSCLPSNQACFKYYLVWQLAILVWPTIT